MAACMLSKSPPGAAAALASRNAVAYATRMVEVQRARAFWSLATLGACRARETARRAENAVYKDSVREQGFVGSSGRRGRGGATGSPAVSRGAGNGGTEGAVPGGVGSGVAPRSAGGVPSGVRAGAGWTAAAADDAGGSGRDRFGIRRHGMGAKRGLARGNEGPKAFVSILFGEESSIGVVDGVAQALKVRMEGVLASPAEEFPSLRLAEEVDVVAGGPLGFSELLTEGSSLLLALDALELESGDLRIESGDCVRVDGAQPSSKELGREIMLCAF